jgi:hypothetical protein
MASVRRSKKSGVSFVWNGEEVERRAKQLAEKSPFEIGLFVQGQAKLLCPVDTGRLRGSIQVASGTGQRAAPGGNARYDDYIKAPADRFETFVGTPVEYANWVEYGTGRNSAQPFLRPANDMARGRALHLVQIGARREFAEYLTTKDIYRQQNEAFTE